MAAEREAGLPGDTVIPVADSGPGAGRSAWRSYFAQPMAVFGLLLFFAILLIALLAPVIAPNDPRAMAGAPLLWPGQDARFPLGTDSLGRDVLAGVVHGARVSLAVGLAATVLSLSLGIMIGAVAGYAGGRIDDIIVRLVEIFQTVPSFVLLVVLVAVAQPSSLTVILGIALVSWDTTARLTRAEFRALSRLEFVMAAESVGYPHRKIILREILPNALPPLIVNASIMVASAILMESALSFMGLSDPGAASWGVMIGSGREMLRTHWYLTMIPGCFIVLTVFALNLIGDGLNDALNPRLRQIG